ncbi:MAG: DUF1295 domain-containing protein [Xanthobacteraceae bacterium]|jgi:steroid 5-alpha reductase family enzyme
MSLVQLVTIAAIAGAVLSASMAIAWWVQDRTANGGWLDVFWTFAVGIAAAGIAVLPLTDPPWLHLRQSMVLGFVAVWVLRIGIGRVVRTYGLGDDQRYRELISGWGAQASRRMFWMAQGQAAAGLALVLSVALAAHNPDPGIRIQDALGPLITAIAVAAGIVADTQLRRFKAGHVHVRAVCDIGLWRWSRHPDYFFEWMAWLAYPVVAVDLSGYNPYGWLSLLGPFCMYWVFVVVSGLRPLEHYMAQTRGEAYRSYQRRTSRFLPLPPSPE